MGEKSVEERIQGLWHRANKLPNLQALNKELVAGWACAANLPVESLEERNIGRFRSFPAVVLKTGNHVAAYPKVSAIADPQWLVNKQQRDIEADLWRKVEWFLPLWVDLGDSRKILSAIEHRNKEEAIQEFDYHTSTIYTLPFQAVCVAQLIPACRSLTEFAPVIREAYLAAYSGYAASSIAALIPVIEGALRKISGSSSDAPVRDVVDLVCDRACKAASRLYYDGMWVPDEYTTSAYLFAQDELVFVFETFRQWLKNAFFRQTGEYDGVTWLNRHLFAHGASTLWQEGANLRRLIVALATLGVIESWHDETYRVSLFFPEMNDDSKLLWQQALLRGYVQAIVDRVNQLDADLVAITGDVVDGSVGQLRAHTAPLGGLTSRHGSYVVTGNHEYYSGAAAWMCEFERIGLRGLHNRHVVITHRGARFILAGVTDFSAAAFDSAQASDPGGALAGSPPDLLRILLAHQPRSAPAAEAAGFDLQLSGHTHGGQFWPWNHFVQLQQPFTAGLHRLGRLAVYTSRGTGYWGPPKRFGAPSEITVLRLIPA